MRERTLGRDGPLVGAVGLGMMGFTFAYGAGDRASMRAVLERAGEVGVNHLDTADAYGPFSGEEMLGRVLADGLGDEFAIATKGGMVIHDAATFDVGRDASPDYLRWACEGSLRRLGRERIDLYYLHRADPAVPIEESVGLLAELQDDGKIGAIGLSEVDVPTLERAMKERRIAAVQSEFSLWSRDPLEDVIPWCEENGVAFVAYSPLGRGFLTGRIREANFAATDLRSHLPRFQADAIAANLELVGRVEAVAERLGASAGQVALAWVLAQGEVTHAIPGTKRPTYLEENAGGGSLVLDEAALQLLDDLPPAQGEKLSPAMQANLSLEPEGERGK
jgi:aryl-alcohol dehydrogenase-like predicted oxidoreductase